MKLNDLYDEFDQLMKEISTDNGEEVKNAVLNHLSKMREKYDYALPMTYTKYAGLRFEKWVVSKLHLTRYPSSWNRGNDPNMEPWRLFDWTGMNYYKIKGKKRGIYPYTNHCPDIMLERTEKNTPAYNKENTHRLRGYRIAIECKWRNDMDHKYAFALKKEEEEKEEKENIDRYNNNNNSWRKITNWLRKEKNNSPNKENSYYDEFNVDAIYIVFGFGWNDERNEPNELYIINAEDYKEKVFDDRREEYNDAYIASCGEKGSVDTRKTFFSECKLEREEGEPFNLDFFNKGDVLVKPIRFKDWRGKGK